MSEKLNEKLIYATAFVVITKIIIACLLPLTGDEAYFITWGNSLASGYYDHTPMTGWIVWLLSQVNDSYLFLRFFVIFIGLISGWLIYVAAVEFYPDKAEDIFYLYMLSPVHLMLLIYSNDVLLFIFIFISTLLFFIALRKDSLLMSVFAGLFFGFAFMSKYLSFPMLIALGGYTLFSRHPRRFLHFVIVCLMIVPFFAQNMLYNYNHCWNNVMFNVLNRTSGKSNIIGNFLGLIGNYVYIFTPWVLYFMYKNRNRLTRSLFPFMMVAVPVVFYIILSFKKAVGLHWLLIFVPYIFVMTGCFTRDQLKRSVKYTMIFTFVHVVLALAVLSVPASLLKGNKEYGTLVAFKYTDEICAELEPYKDDFLVTKSYVFSSVLDVKCDRRVHVLFSASKHGRQDDFNFDIRDAQGKKIIYVSRKPVEQKQFAHFFENVDISSFNVRGHDFYLVRGDGFRLDAYKSEYLTNIKEKFYNFPSWLPVGKCQFTERYF